jgi:hypothetical protein
MQGHVPSSYRPPVVADFRDFDGCFDFSEMNLVSEVVLAQAARLATFEVVPASSLVSCVTYRSFL